MDANHGVPTSSFQNATAAVVKQWKIFFFNFFFVLLLVSNRLITSDGTTLLVLKNQSDRARQEL